MTIEQLQALEAKATPGPWYLSKDGNIVQTAHVTRDVWIIPRSDGDMACIAAARNALPALLEVAMAAKVLIGRNNSDDWFQLNDALNKLEETK